MYSRTLFRYAGANVSISVSTRCGADAQTNKTLCVFHDPARMSDGHRARKAGGIHRSRAAAALPADTPDLAPSETKSLNEECGWKGGDGGQLGRRNTTDGKPKPRRIIT
jgi:hypothetical protein